MNAPQLIELTGKQYHLVLIVPLNCAWRMIGVDRVLMLGFVGRAPSHGYNRLDHGIVVLILGQELWVALMTALWLVAFIHYQMPPIPLAALVLILRHCRVFEAFPDFIFKLLDLEVSGALETLREIRDPMTINPIDLSSSERTASAVSERGRSGEASSASVNCSRADLEDVTPKMRPEGVKSPETIVDAFESIPPAEAEQGVPPALECRHEAKYIVSILNGCKVEKLWSTYKFPVSMSYRVPGSEDRACLPRPGEITVYESALSGGLRLCGFVASCYRWGEDLTPEDFFYCYKVTDCERSGWYYFSAREGQPAMVSGFPASHKRWKEKFFFVYGEGMEIAHWEVTNDQTPRIPREWGKPARIPVLEDQARTNRVERVRGHPVTDWAFLVRDENQNAIMGFDKRNLGGTGKKKFEEMEKAKAAGERPSKRRRPVVGGKSADGQINKVPAVSSPMGALAPSITQVPAQISEQEASVPPLTSEAPSQPEQPIEPFIMEDMQAAWKRMLQFISFDDVIPLNDWTNAQLTKSMNHDALKLHVKALCLSTRLKTKASEGAQKGKVIESLTKTNEDLEKQLKAAEGFKEAAEVEKSAALNDAAELKKKNKDLISEVETFEAVKASLVSRVAELEEQLKAVQEKDGIAFQEEINEAYLDGFIDAKVAAKELFPDLDFSALKPADDTVSQAVGGDQNPIVEEDDAQS
ncbi:hypothetical protein Acr_15g0005180 [Actinidia rufa]|uniref:Uncharacterized protein n=1 Tax=Actinidia rufa TaxID=165716 RepID=A0A7J0FT78_9ERIC|nr:hypothetical protein Acr_15g0005180 [Actinidia rufa]